MGQPVLNPLVNYLRGVEKTIAQLEAAYGMHPRARADLRLIFRQEQLTATQINEIAAKAAKARPA